MKWAAHLCASARLSNSNEVHRGSPLGESIASRWSDNSKECDYNGKPFINCCSLILLGLSLYFPNMKHYIVLVQYQLTSFR